MESPIKKFNTSRLLFTAGVCWLTLGIFALVNPSATYRSLVQYAGIALLLDGLLLVALSYLGNSSKKEKTWRVAEAIVDISFSSILLLDPVLAFFAFPFVVSPWMVIKGLLKMVASTVLARNIPGQRGDFLAGLLLLVFGLLIPHDPASNPYGITLLIGIIGWTLGLLYMYDCFPAAGHRHT
ncbi:MAG: DUF308 domain-containing protein [Puia sp.]|nr:DUF308 domain-containing protein [Puia sp.]